MIEITQKRLTSLKPYSTRPIRFVDYFSIADWQIKLYWISWKSDTPDSNIVDESIKIISKRLASVTKEFAHYNIGFGMIHEGKDGTYVIASYWIEENMLDHMVFLLDPTHPDGFKRLQPDSIITCVWELEILYFEKKAWLECVLKNSGDVESYMEQTLNTDV